MNKEYLEMPHDQITVFFTWLTLGLTGYAMQLDANSPIITLICQSVKCHLNTQEACHPIEICSTIHARLYGGYMRCPCKGHGMGYLWLLLPKPNTGGDNWYEIHRPEANIVENMDGELIFGQGGQEWMTNPGHPFSTKHPIHWSVSKYFQCFIRSESKLVQ